ncbi:hypothetical protein DFH09DRAFT_847089, partial [Mycena vulgaris]
SSDGADFYAHRAVLALVLPVFQTMVTLPQADDIPVVDMSEHSALLDQALRFFYP